MHFKRSLQASNFFAIIIKSFRVAHLILIWCSIMFEVAGYLFFLHEWKRYWWIDLIKKNSIISPRKTVLLFFLSFFGIRSLKSEEIFFSDFVYASRFSAKFPNFPISRKRDGKDILTSPSRHSSYRENEIFNCCELWEFLWANIQEIDLNNFNISFSCSRY